MHQTNSTPIEATCVMITTHGRRRMIERSIEQFAAQTITSNVELLVVSEDLEVARLTYHPRVLFVPSTNAQIGHKYNLGANIAQGRIVLHWDDDDIQAPDRIEQSIVALLDPRKVACGSRRLTIWDSREDRAYEYRCPMSQRTRWFYGATLAYKRSFWERNRFPTDVTNGVECFFLRHVPQDEVTEIDDLCMAVVHYGNVSPKVLTQPNGFWPIGLPRAWREIANRAGLPLAAD